MHIIPQKVSLKLINVLFEVCTHYVPKMLMFSLHHLTYLIKTEKGITLTWTLKAWALETKR